MGFALPTVADLRHDVVVSSASGDPVAAAITPSSAGTARLAGVLAWVVAAVVLAQAVIAGRSERLFGSWDISLHGALGNGAFGLALALVALAAMRRQRMPLVAAGCLTLVLTAQLGLGYAGRANLDAAAWHIPTGVLSFGVAVWNAAIAGRAQS